MARTGGAQVFFDVLATFNAKRLLQDTKTVNTMMKAAYLDTLNTLTGEFQALGQIIDDFTEEVIASSRAFEEARIDFEKFVNVSEEMQGLLPVMVEEVVKIGEGFAFTGEEALKAASRMAQMGAVIGKSTIGVGTEVGVMFGLISGMETDSAMRRLTNLMQQTGFHMATNLDKTERLTAAQFNMLSAIEKENMFRKNSIEVLNQLNTVENRSIATMDQLTYTMNQFAAQASLTNSSIAEMAAMSAALIEAGEQQGAAGRALRMMYARLGGNIAGARDEMQSMGIEVIDSENNMKTLLQIMEDLNEKGWHEMTGIQQQNIAQTVSGNRHYVRFIKLMENLHRVTDLTSDSLFDFDSAQEEANRRLEQNAVVLEGVETRLENVSAQIGTALLPGMIRGSKATLMWNQELEKFVSGDYGGNFEQMANAIVGMRSIVGIVGPFIQLQIIGRGIAVAFGAMRSVIAGIKGDTIALNRQYFKSTALMEISNSRTRQQRDMHKDILTLQGEMNNLSHFQAAEEQRIVDIEHLRAEILTKQLATELHIFEAKRNNTIQAQLVAQRNRDLLTLGSSINGKMKERLTILQNQWQMEFLLKDSEQSRMHINKESVILSQADARLQIDKAMIALRRITIEKTAAGHAASSASRRINSLQSEMIIQGKISDIQGTIMTFTKKATGAEETAANKAMQNYTTKLNTLKLLGKTEHFTRGEMMHLDTIVKLYGGYERMIQNTTNLRAELLAMIEQERYTTGEKAAMEHKMLKDLGIELQLRGKTTEEIREALVLAREGLLVQQRNLEATQMKVAAEEKANQYAYNSKQFAMGTLAASSGTLTTLSMALPIMGGISGDAGLMKLSMLAMNLSMIPMVGNMAKGAIETTKIALNLQLADNAMDAAAVKMNRLKVAAAATGAIMTLGMVLAINQMVTSSEKLKTNIQDMRTEFAETFAIIESAQNQEFLITNEKLAAAYNVQGVELKRLATDYEYAKQVQADFTRGIDEQGSAMNQANKDTVNSTRSMLDSIVDLHAQAANELERTFKKIEAMQIETQLRGQMWDEDFWVALTEWRPLMGAEQRKNLKALTTKLGFAYNVEGLGLTSSAADMFEAMVKSIKAGYKFTEDELETFEEYVDIDSFAARMLMLQDIMQVDSEAAQRMLDSIGGVGIAASDTAGSIGLMGEDINNLTEGIYNFSGAREELFFGGKYGNVTGSLYRQVVQQGVGTLYHKNEVIMSNNFHGFFNEEQAAQRIIDILDDYFAER